MSPSFSCCCCGEYSIYIIYFVDIFYLHTSHKYSTLQHHVLTAPYMVKIIENLMCRVEYTFILSLQCCASLILAVQQFSSYFFSSSSALCINWFRFLFSSFFVVVFYVCIVASFYSMATNSHHINSSGSMIFSTHYGQVYQCINSSRPICTKPYSSI